MQTQQTVYAQEQFTMETYDKYDKKLKANNRLQRRKKNSNKK